MSAAQPRHPGTCGAKALGACLFALVAAFWSGPDAQAHERIGTVSHSIVTANGATVEDYLSIPPALWSRLKVELEDTPDALREYFQATVRIATWDKTCDLQSVTRTAFRKTGNTLSISPSAAPRTSRIWRSLRYLFSIWTSLTSSLPDSQERTTRESSSAKAC